MLVSSAAVHVPVVALSVVLQYVSVLVLSNAAVPVCGAIAHVCVSTVYSAIVHVCTGYSVAHIWSSCIGQSGLETKL